MWGTCWIGDRELLGRGPFFGAWAIDEQQRPSIPAHLSSGCCSRVGLPCRSAGWGAINAIYYEKTRDSAARETLFRSLTWPRTSRLRMGK